ncbi:MAG TPA: hypothetical protein VJG49_03400 [Candidatus Nanoarchaeia archaeon]|nr:hypothetical protein [Candidatus Nanoarchaeia archaeon]
MAKPALQQPPDFDSAKLYLWVKALEGKVNNLLREVDILKNDFINKNSQLKKDLKIFNEELLETRREHEQTLQRMDLIIRELKQTAGIEEVTTLKKYLEFWNPMNFVTQKDLDRILEIKLTEKHK